MLYPNMSDSFVEFKSLNWIRFDQFGLNWIGLNQNYCKILPWSCSIRTCLTVPLSLKVRLNMCLSSLLSRTKNEPSGSYWRTCSAASPQIGPQYQSHWKIWKNNYKLVHTGSNWIRLDPIGIWIRIQVL